MRLRQVNAFHPQAAALDASGDHMNALRIMTIARTQGSACAFSTALIHWSCAADQAFFDASLLPLLYFPEEHIYAVFAPFFVPTVVPVLAAVFTALKSFVRPPNPAPS